MHSLCPKRPSVPPRKTSWHFIILLKEQAKCTEVKLNKSLSAPIHISQQANRRKVHKVYFSITQSALSKCSSQLFNNITSTQLPGILLASFHKGPSTSCPPQRCYLTPHGWTTRVATNQPSHPMAVFCTLHLQGLGTVHTTCQGKSGFAPGMQQGVDCVASGGEMQATAHTGLGAIWVPPGLRCPGLTHLSTEARTLPTAHPACPRWGVLPPCTPEHGQHH